MRLAKVHWTRAGEFRNRSVELARLERWWRSNEREPLSLYGRRRVGKSWLFRRFAHGKPAILLVADQVARGMQLERLAAQLEPVLGVRPKLETTADLLRVLLKLAKAQKILIVLDEFPYLLGATQAERKRTLSSLQAVLEEERDHSKAKLLLTGSTIATMEELQLERSPLHGRLVPFPLKPMKFSHARALMDTSDPLAQLTCYSIAGGMPRYLAALQGRPGARSLLEAVKSQILDPYGPLFNEPRTMLSVELREPTTYFSILATLARNPQHTSDIADKLRLESKELTGYLHTLEQLQLVSRHLPVGAKVAARTTQWRCDDDFVRFWFRFVQPHQAELEAGLDPAAVIKRWIVPHLSDHSAITFERIVLEWMRARYTAAAPQVGAWWGPALHALRREQVRTTEEIDVVVLDGRKVLAVAEAKWTNAALSFDVLRDLSSYKLPALQQAGYEVGDVEIVLASRSGFTREVTTAAKGNRRIRLVDAHDILSA